MLCMVAQSELQDLARLMAINNECRSIEANESHSPHFHRTPVKPSKHGRLGCTETLLPTPGGHETAAPKLATIGRTMKPPALCNSVEQAVHLTLEIRHRDGMNVAICSVRRAILSRYAV